MCNETLKRKGILSIVVIVVLCMINPVFAIDHWWHGGVSANVNDPANWTDRNASTEPTTPTGSPYDIVRIGGSWDSEDLNGNGVLDPGEDLNGNGIIDDPDPNSGIGYGGYYGSGGGIDLAVDPVLNTTYVSRTGGSEGGWWFVLNAPNILTLKDGAFLIMSRENCNLRNGGRLEVQGRSDTGGPSLIVARRFRIAENGAISEAAGETSQLRINGTGWVQMDPTLNNNGEAFMIGTSDTPGTMPRGEIIIEDNGRLELLSADPAPYLVFGNADPSVNQIIIRDKGELWLPGDPATMGRVGPDDTETSLQDMIDMGLITSDQGMLTVSGANPTVVKLVNRRIANPSPADTQTDVATQTVLSWDPGTLASTHDVYFGTDSVSVGSASRDNPLDVLKNQDQVEAYYPLDGTLSLEYGQTYFWRVDEVNATEGAVYEGSVWSFTVEPFARAISAGDIIATASSQAEGQGPENTINESGLVEDLHSTEPTAMWATIDGEALPAWIQYEFDKPYKLHDMLVWNYNGQSLLSAVGPQDVTVEYSTDGVDWKTNDSVSVFNRATGEEGYAANTTVPFSGVTAKYVKITVNSNWGGTFFTQYGLSEVRFLYIPVNARLPNPGDGASGVNIDATLSWRAGREAAEHKVYISTDEQVVIDGTVAAETVSEASYGPLALDLGTTYYWRVDEVNNTNTVPVWEGDVWGFTASEYRVVDDFETYNDIPESEEGSNLVYLTWIDGYENPSTNGSTIGYTSGASLEIFTVRSGHSAPLMYNNTTAGISEVTANTNDLQSGSNWTIGAPEELVIWVYGSADNPSTDQMYVEVDGVKKVFSGDIALEEWQQFSIDLASLGINLSNVGTVTIGLEKTGATGGNGTVFIDDIWLFAPQE